MPMDCRVAVETAIRVYHVDTTDEAIRVVIAKTGDMLNSDLSYVEISPGPRVSPTDEALTPTFLVAGGGLVALNLEMAVFNVEDEVHASRIALTEIGQQLDGFSSMAMAM